MAERLKNAGGTPRIKTMANRPGQNGRIVRKGCQWHLRFLEDIAGQYARVDRSVRIATAAGPNAVSKTKAKQLGAAYLAEKGINTQEHFDRTCGSFKTGSSVITFADRAQFWFDNMHDIVRGRTWDSMTSAINKHLLPALKDVPVDAIDEDVAQSFVTTLTKKSLSPKSVRVYFGYLRSVLGKKKTRDWDVKLPELSSKERFMFTRQQLAMIVAACEGQLRALVISDGDGNANKRSHRTTCRGYRFRSGNHQGLPQHL
jgi:hypothetical protein